MNEPITSRQNTRIKNAAKLRERKGRDEQGRIIIDGVREISRAFSAGIELIELFVTDQHISQEARGLLAEINVAVDVVAVTRPVFAKLAFGDRAEGVIAVARTPHRNITDLEVDDQTIVAVLERVEKPGNVGAVIRSADAAGVSAIIVAEPGTDLYNPNAIRASAGTIFSLPMVASTTVATQEWLQTHDFNVFAARVDGAIDYTAASYVDKTAIILGSEAHGLSDAWTGPQVTAVKLPMCGVADSLNVSVSAAVLFYEAMRQRT